jgi:predicted extracellular nuclease
MRRFLIAVLAAAAILTVAASAWAQAPPGLVINEIDYDQPGTDAAEFVELRNNGSAAAPLAGYSVRLVNGANNAAATYQTVALPDVSLAAGGYFVVCANASTTPDCDLDVEPATNLIQNGAPDAVALMLGDAIVDTVSYEGAVPGYTEGAGAPEDSGEASASFQSISRPSAGTDTNSNASDFAVRCATPGAANAANATGCTDPNGPVELQVTRIHAIQGPGSASPMSGQTVTIEGVVTGVDDEIGSNFERTFPADAGIFVQEETGDADSDPLTSEGIYVAFVSDRDNFPPGTRVRVNGRVRENFGETRLEETFGEQPTPIGTAAVPAPVVIDPAAAAAQDETARAYYETLEGMNVRLDVGTATVGGRNKFGETFLSPGVRQRPEDRVFRTESAPDLIAADSDAGAGDPSNPLVDTDSTTDIPADLFDVVRNLEGPVGFSFSHYKILSQEAPRPQPVVEEGPTQYPYDDLAPQGRGELRVATYNVENFFPVGGDVDRRLITKEEYEEKRTRVVDAIGDLLERPDVVALQEVVDKATADDIARHLGGYTAYLEEGNDERGIDVAFLVKDTVRESDPRQLGKTATAPESQTNECADSDGQNLLFDRPPLAIDIQARGVKFTVISNHFASKSNPDECREAQAQFVRDRVAEIEAGGGEAIVTGDLNSFEDEIALQVLEDDATTLDNLWDEAPEQERYSFQFGGRLQTLDHLLATEGLAPRVEDFRYPHINNDYYDRRDPADGHRSSDHDPAIVTLSLPGDVTPLPPAGGSPGGGAGQPAAPGRVLSVRMSRRCYRDVTFGGRQTRGRRALRFTYRLSAAAPVRITVRRRKGSPRWRSCPKRAGKRSAPYNQVAGRGESGRPGINRSELGTARPSAVRSGSAREPHAGRRGGASIAQVVGARRLKAGTYLLEVTSLDEAGRPVSRKHVKFWALRPR